MKNIAKILRLILALCLVVCVIAACNPPEPDNPDKPDGKDDFVQQDYVAQLKLDMSSNTAKQEVTVKTFIDGDTTHFNVPDSVIAGGVLKARYLAINTPESTGKIEEYGKQASNFTKEKLSSAAKILVESDSSAWEADSTGSRYLSWVWYKAEAGGEWRNLNLEILQNGLARASNTSGNRYGEICVKALNQAQTLKLKIYSGEKDPEMFYGEALEITLKELRTNLTEYTNKKVAFEGIVAADNNDGVYVESYDEETGLYFGIYVYYGKTANGDVLRILSVGNRVRVVGSVSEFNGSYQVSGVGYRAMKPDDPNNLQIIEQGKTGAYKEIDVNEFLGKKTVSVLDNSTNEPTETDKEFDYAYLILNTSVTLKNVVVTSTYTTVDESSSQQGAVTITGTVGGKTVTIRTVVLQGSDGKTVTEDYYKGKTITVKGVVDVFNGKYQVKVLSISDVTIL